jgi:hypothetical protein
LNNNQIPFYIRIKDNSMKQVEHGKEAHQHAATSAPAAASKSLYKPFQLLLLPSGSASRS